MKKNMLGEDEDSGKEDEQEMIGKEDSVRR